MRSPWPDVALVVVLVGGGTLVAYRFGGGADPEIAPPTPAARAAGPAPPRPSGCVRLLFAGAGTKRRFAGHLAVTTPGGTLRIDRLGLSEDAVKTDGAGIALAVETRPGEPVGLVLHVTPPEAVVTWDLRLDDHALPEDRVFGGHYGFAMPELGRGLGAPLAWHVARARVAPEIDAARELGMFVGTGCDQERAGEGAPGLR